jgi:hypothetical protein
MVDLTDWLIEAAKKDDQLPLVFFDFPTAGGDPKLSRDSYFLKNFTEEFLKFRADQAIVLIGGMHAAKFNELADKTLRLEPPHDSKRVGAIVLMPLYKAGTAWNCTGFTIKTLVCGANVYGDSWPSTQSAINEIRFIDSGDRFFDGFFYVDKISASPSLLRK